MELNIKFDEKLMVKTANRVLDEYEYNGKTIREWADLIANPKTEADRIRAMTDEELADMFSSISCCHEKGQDCMKYSDGMGGRNCYRCWLDWLKQEASE